jgi:hypothetical protein
MFHFDRQGRVKTPHGSTACVMSRPSSDVYDAESRVSTHELLMDNERFAGCITAATHDADGVRYRSNGSR